MEATDEMSNELYYEFYYCIIPESATANGQTVNLDSLSYNVLQDGNIESGNKINIVKTALEEYTHYAWYIMIFDEVGNTTESEKQSAHTYCSSQLTMNLEYCTGLMPVCDICNGDTTWTCTSESFESYNTDQSFTECWYCDSEYTSYSAEKCTVCGGIFEYIVCLNMSCDSNFGTNGQRGGHNPCPGCGGLGYKLIDCECCEGSSDNCLECPGTIDEKIENSYICFSCGIGTYTQTSYTCTECKRSGLEQSCTECGNLGGDSLYHVCANDCDNGHFYYPCDEHSLDSLHYYCTECGYYGTEQNHTCECEHGATGKHD